MIGRLVDSAIKTGCLSVESEGLIRQIMRMRNCQPDDLQALQALDEALRSGQVQREANAKLEFSSMYSNR